MSKFKTIAKVILGIALPPVGLGMIAHWHYKTAKPESKKKVMFGWGTLGALVVLGYLGNLQDSSEAEARGMSVAELRAEKDLERKAERNNMTVVEYEAHVKEEAEKARIAKAQAEKLAKLSRIVTIRISCDLMGNRTQAAQCFNDGGSLKIRSTSGSKMLSDTDMWSQPSKNGYITYDINFDDFQGIQARKGYGTDSLKMVVEFLRMGEVIQREEQTRAYGFITVNK